MLFEIFFGPTGDLRDRFKMSHFNHVFDLQKHHEYQSSFDFIAECLIPFDNRFYMIPGKERTVVIDIASTKNEKGENIIKAVHFAGSNILRKDADYEDFVREGEIRYSPKRKDSFEDMVSEEMVIAKRFLLINSSFKDEARPMILFPYYYTLSKG